MDFTLGMEKNIGVDLPSLGAIAVLEALLKEPNLRRSRQKQDLVEPFVEQVWVEYFDRETSTT